MRSLHGNTHGLKPNQLRRIERLYTRRIPPREIVTPEFARQLSELSHETNRQIGVLIDRKGYVEYVVVGDARRIELPDFKRVRVAGDRFRGLRFVHTHLRGEELTQDDLTDLALLRLDLMVAIDVHPESGLPGLMRAAHLLPITAQSDNNASARITNQDVSKAEGIDLSNLIEDSATDGGALSQKGRTQRSTTTNSQAKLTTYSFLEPRIPSQMDVDFLGLINSLEEEMARNRRTTRRAEVRDRTILVGVATGSLAEAEESRAELHELA